MRWTESCHIWPKLAFSTIYHMSMTHLAIRNDLKSRWHPLDPASSAHLEMAVEQATTSISKASCCICCSKATAISLEWAANLQLDTCITPSGHMPSHPIWCRFQGRIPCHHIGPCPVFKNAALDIFWGVAPSTRSKKIESATSFVVAGCLLLFVGCLLLLVVVDQITKSDSHVFSALSPALTSGLAENWQLTGCDR